MIPESQKNTVFFSSLFKLDYPHVYRQLHSILSDNGVRNGLITNTADYWCRDYMPLQITDRLLYRPIYFPDYLRGEKKYLTNPSETRCSLEVELDTLDSEIVLDGGNGVACGPNTVVMSEKVFYENYDMSRDEISRQLEMDLDAEIIWLPWNTSDITGHTDGIVRPVDADTLLIDTSDYDNETAEEIRRRLSERFKIVEFGFVIAPKNSWSYINAIQTDYIIIVPGLGIPEDKIALQRYIDLFPDYSGRIFQVPIPEIINKFGGALNCLTWTVKM